MEAHHSPPTERSASLRERSMIGDDFRQVLDAARVGDEDAFARIWRSLNPQVTRYLRVVCRDAADDVASEAWSRIASDLDRFDGDERGFRSWVFTIARHRAVDWTRNEARRPVEPRPVEDLVEQVMSDDPADIIVRSESTNAALDLIGTLPPNQAEVVTLRTVAGFDVGEVATILGKRPGAVRVLSHRGLHNLAGRIVDADSESGSERVLP